ncbi:MAG: hypothetical protein AAGI70_04480, partial [Pseudomonadota bacterium]
DDDLHAQWYERFWTGDCGDLPWWWCLVDAPDWPETVAELSARHGAALDPGLAARLCLTGERLGYEWARANDIRRIDSDDLKAWRKALLATDDIAAEIASLEARATARLGVAPPAD